MSNSRLHKLLGLWKNVGIDPIPFKLQRYFDRFNFDIPEGKLERNKKKDRILNKEMNNELKIKS
jgi:hypothetical protein